MPTDDELIAFVENAITEPDDTELLGFVGSLPKKVEAYTKASQVMSASPPLQPMYHAYASQIPAEDRSLFIAIAANQFAKDQAMKKAGYGARLMTSTVQGMFDVGMPLAKWAPGSPLPELDPDQERFLQQLTAAREAVDPTVRPAAEAAREAVPEVMSAAMEGGDPKQAARKMGRGYAIEALKGAGQKAARMAFPMLHSVAAGKGLGRAAQSLGWGKTAQTAAQVLGTSGAFYPQIADQTYSSLIAEGVPPEKAWKIAAVSAVVESAVESFQLNPFAAPQRAAFRGTVKQVTAKLLKEYTKNYAKELSEEGVQRLVNEIALETGRRLEESIPNKGFGHMVPAALAEMKETAMPLALLMGPGAAMGTAGVASESARRAERLAELKALRTVKPQELKKEAAKLGIEGTRNEIRKKIDAQVDEIEQQITQWAKEGKDASTVRSPEEEIREAEGGEHLRGAGEVEVPAEPPGKVAETPEVPVEEAPERPRFPLPQPPAPAEKAPETPEKSPDVYPLVGDLVDGRKVLAGPVPSTDSIEASLGDQEYTVLPGIREVPMSDFELTGRHYSVEGNRAIRELQRAIEDSGEVTPLIVVQEDEGPYVLEGATRVEALYNLGAKSFPALVVDARTVAEVTEEVTSVLDAAEREVGVSRDDALQLAQAIASLDEKVVNAAAVAEAVQYLRMWQDIEPGQTASAPVTERATRAFEKAGMALPTWAAGEAAPAKPTVESQAGEIAGQWAQQWIAKEKEGAPSEKAEPNRGKPPLKQVMQLARGIVDTAEVESMADAMKEARQMMSDPSQATSDRARQAFEKAGMSLPAAKKAPSKTEGTERDFGQEPSVSPGGPLAAGLHWTNAVPVTPPRGGLGKSIEHFFRRFFTAPGELPNEAYDAKVRKEGRVAKEMNKLRLAASDFRRAVRKALGSKELRQADVEKMNAVLRGEADPSTVPEGVRAPLQAMRDHIDSLSRSLIAEGVAQGDLVGIIEKNMGVYVTRSYRIFTDPKWRDKVPEPIYNRAWHAVSEMHPEKSEAERLGILESLLFRGAAETPMQLLKSSKLGSKDLGIFMKRKDVPKWLRDLWGEYREPGVNYAQSVFKMAHLLANQQFLNEVREAGLGKWLRTKEDGPIVNEYGEVITPIAADESSVMAPLNGLYTTPEIKRAFEQANRAGAMPDLLRVFMAINYVVKYGKTVGSLMTHVRNYIANPGFAIANGHWRIWHVKKAHQEIAAHLLKSPDAQRRAYYNRLLELGLAGEDVRSGELHDALRDASKMNVDEYLYNQPARQVRWLSRTARAGYKGLNAFYQAEDVVWKIFAWENEKGRYREAHPEWSEKQVEEHAATIVRDTYPTYSKISTAVKGVRRFPLVGTFVSFPAEVVRTTFNTARLGLEEMQSPETRSIGAERLAGLTLSLAGLSALSWGTMALLGIGADEDDDLRWFVPPWQENSRFLYMAKPEDATYRFVDLGYSDPHAYLTDSVVAFWRGEGWVDSLGKSTAEFLRPFTSEEILAKMLMDLRSNEDEKIYNPKDDAGEIAKDVVAHMWTEALEPGTVSSLRRIHEAATGVNPSREPLTEVLALITGQRLQKVDVEHSLGFRVRDFAKELTLIQNIARKTATSRGTVTKEMIAADRARMERIRLAAFAEMQRIVGAAKRLGVPENSIWAILKGELPDHVASQLMTGDYSAYQMTPQTVRQMMKARPEEFEQRTEGWRAAE